MDDLLTKHECCVRSFLPLGASGWWPRRILFAMVCSDLLGLASQQPRSGHLRGTGSVRVKGVPQYSLVFLRTPADRADPADPAGPNN